MKESPNNVVAVCKDCADKRREETQRHLPVLDTLVNRWVKKAFSDPNGVEHMWVKVTGVGVGGKTLIGTLDNDPVIVTNVSLHDEVIVGTSEIEEVY